MATIEVVQADVTKLEVDAIANAANTQLRHGGGVAAAIARAEQLGCRSLALVAFGTGVGGFPLEDAGRLMVAAAREHDGDLERIVFAVFGDEAERAFEAAL